MQSRPPLAESSIDPFGIHFGWRPTSLGAVEVQPAKLHVTVEGTARAITRIVEQAADAFLEDGER